MTSDQRQSGGTATPQLPRRSGGAAGGNPGEVSFTEQLAQQLGGWRGLVESGIPVLVFVILNIVIELRPAIIGSVAVAVAMAIWRLIRRKPIRHAVNGLFGIGLGAYLAWRSGNAGAYYLPGILINLAWGVGMVVSVVAGHPAMGWLYSVVAAKGSTTWRQNPRLVRTLNWLTLLGAVIFLAKGALQYQLFRTDHDTVLGVTRIALGYPSYAFLLTLTIWSVRRAGHTEPSPAGQAEPAA